MEKKTERDMAPKKGNKKKKNGKKKKASGGKRFPLQIFASGGGLKQVDVDEIDSSVLYHKSVTGAIQVKLGDVAVRGKVAMSYDICLILPGYGVSRQGGVLCDLMGSTYLLQNPSPYTLTVRMQRPMGFKDDCASLAMWEPIGGELVYSIKPRGMLKLGSANNSTSHMTPREITLSGRRCVHLASFAVYREPLTDYGSSPDAKILLDEAGLILEVVTRYKSVNGDAGQTDGYAVESFRGTDRLNHICHGPLVKLRLGDISVMSGPVGKVYLVEEKGFIQLLFASSDGESQYASCDLDPGTSYRLDAPLLLNLGGKVVVSNVIGARAVAQDYIWVYGAMGDGGNEIKFVPCQPNPNTVLPSGLPADTWLTPIALSKGTKVRSRGKQGVIGLQCNRLKGGGYQAHRDLDASFLLTFVKAVVVIYEVSKVAVELLGVIGVLANPDLKQAERVDGVLD